MADIDFLSSDDDEKEEEGKKEEKHEAEDMEMHVPAPLPEKEAEDASDDSSGAASGPRRDKETSGGDLLHPKEPEIRVTPPAPKPAPQPKETPKMVVPPVVEKPKPAQPAVPPKPPKPPTPPESPTPPPEKGKKGSTLRVSLLGGDSGASMTDLTVRARMKTFIIVLILAFAADALIYGGILFYKSRVMRNIQEISAGVEDLDRRISDAEKVVLPAQDFQRLAELSKTLLEKHLHWTNFLAMLERRTLKDVQFINLTGVETGTITSNMVARDYTTLAKQILMLKDDPDVSDASLTGASAKYGEQGLLIGASAAFRIQFSPALLSKGATADGTTSTQ